MCRFSLLLLALVIVVSAQAQVRGPVWEVGLDKQLPIAADLDFDPLGTYAPSVYFHADWLAPAYLGVGASLEAKADSWRVWLLLHPEAADIRDIPRDEASHRVLTAELTLRYFKQGNEIGHSTTQLKPSGKFRLGPCNQWSCYPTGVDMVSDRVTLPAVTADADSVAFEIVAADGQSTSRPFPLGKRGLLQSTAQSALYAFTTRFANGGVTRVIQQLGQRTPFVGGPLEIAYHSRFSGLDAIERQPRFQEALSKVVVCREKYGRKPPEMANINHVVTQTFTATGADYGPYEQLPGIAAGFVKGFGAMSYGFRLDRVPQAKSVDFNVRYELRIDPKINGFTRCNTISADESWVYEPEQAFGTYYDSPTGAADSFWSIPVR